MSFESCLLHGSIFDEQKITAGSHVFKVALFSPQESLTLEGNEIQIWV